MPSVTFTRAVLAQDTGEQAALLVTIAHASLGTPIRVTDAGADIVSGGQTFVAYPFELSLPDDPQDRLFGEAQVKIDNIDPVIAATLRSLTTRPDVTIQLVLVSAPDVIEFAWTGLKLGDPSITAGEVEAALQPRDFGEETFPKQRFTPVRTPGLF